MALLDTHDPTPRDLKIFGILLAGFGGLFGAWMLYRTGTWLVAGGIWTIASVLCALYCAIPAARYIIYQAWMALVYPIGWLISHALLATIYYLMITPIGVVMRLAGRDPLQRVRDRSATTYWKRYTTPEGTRRYFQQF